MQQFFFSGNLTVYEIM